MSPVISVVIPSFNHQQFVGETLASVLSQTFADFEIVITDDGSSDGTVEAIREFSDSRIDLLALEKNNGAAAALNSSIRRSRGEFICYLSSDDKFLPGKLEQQLDFLRKNSSLAATFGMPNFIDDRGLPLAEENQFNGQVFRAPFNERLLSREDWLRRFFFFGNCLCHPTMMIRRSVYDEIGLYDPRLANLPDFDMWVRLCMAHTIHVSAEEVTSMRIRDDNLNMSTPKSVHMIRANMEFFQILKHYKSLSREEIGKIFSNEIQKNSLGSIKNCAVLLAELALISPRPFHKLFGLDAMFENTSEAADADYSHLIRLMGANDIFGEELGARLRHQDEALHATDVKVLELTNTVSREAENGKSLRKIIESLQQIIQLAYDELAGLQQSRFFTVLKMNKNYRQQIERLASILRRGIR
jgi:glycosyltransferase involved in cell wall biosynthesis